MIPYAAYPGVTSMMSEITDGIYDKIETILYDYLKPNDMNEFQASKILDVGCGSGRSTIMMEDIYPEIDILGQITLLFAKN